MYAGLKYSLGMNVCDNTIVLIILIDLISNQITMYNKTNYAADLQQAIFVNSI